MFLLNNGAASPSRSCAGKYGKTSKPPRFTNLGQEPIPCHFAQRDPREFSWRPEAASGHYTSCCHNILPKVHIATYALPKNLSRMFTRTKTTLASFCGSHGCFYMANWQYIMASTAVFTHRRASRDGRPWRVTFSHRPLSPYNTLRGSVLALPSKATGASQGVRMSHHEGVYANCRPISAVVSSVASLAGDPGAYRTPACIAPCAACELSCAECAWGLCLAEDGLHAAV